MSDWQREIEGFSHSTVHDRVVTSKSATYHVIEADGRSNRKVAHGHRPDKACVLTRRTACHVCSLLRMIFFYWWSGVTKRLRW